MTKEHTNVDGKQDLVSHVHDDSESTILYDYMDYMEDNRNSKTELEIGKAASNIAVSTHSDHLTNKTMDTSDNGSDSPKQKDIETSEKVTPAITAKTEFGIQKTLRIRLQKLTKRQLDEATTQTNKISNLRAKNIKSTKSYKKSYASSSDTKARSLKKLPKFAISSHSLLRKKRKKYNFRCPITGCKKFLTL